MTKVQSDRHGLYIRTGGYVFRPIESDESYEFHTIFDETTVFAAGDQVKARHISNTPFAVVRNGRHEEYWHSHGCYFDEFGKPISSEQIWHLKDQR